MLQALRIASVTFGLYLLLFLPPARSQEAEMETCLPARLDLLQKLDPNGYSIYQALTDKATFRFFCSCDAPDVQALDTAVHESLHLLDLQDGARSRGRSHFYRLIDQGHVRSPSDGTFFRSEVFKDLQPAEKKDPYASIYLQGASGKQGLHMLLEELNAYAHGANTTIRLAEGLSPPSLGAEAPVDPRAPTPRLEQVNDGLAHMMYYLGLYAARARSKPPATWHSIQRGYAEAIDALWEQGERMLLKSCASSAVRLGGDYVDKAYAESNLKALQELVGPRFQPQTEKLRECMATAETNGRVHRSRRAPPPLESRPEEGSPRKQRPEIQKIEINGKAASPEEIEQLMRDVPGLRETLENLGTH